MSNLPSAAEQKLDDATAEFFVLTREDVIRAGVLASLGKPTGLFRVNVLVGDTATAVQIPNSYFVTTDDHGNILGAQPPLQKLY
jgi:hypothetical protein